MRLPDATALYLGQDPAIEAYLGDVLVWPFPFYTGCTPEGGVMSVSGLVDGGEYVIYGCGYETIFDTGGGGVTVLSGSTCEASITGDTISITGATAPLVFKAKIVDTDMFRLTTEISGDTYYLWAVDGLPSKGYVDILVLSAVGSPTQAATLFTLNNGHIQSVLYNGYEMYMCLQKWSRTETYVNAQEPEWVYRNVDMKNNFKAWMRLYNIANPPAPITGYTFVNSIYPEGTYVQNRINLPFKTALGMEFDFEGEILANVGGICFGGIHISDNNDFRFFASTVCYYDVSNKRISISGANRGDIRKVHTYNYGFELTFANGTVRSATGTTLTEAPELDATIEIGRQKIKHFKATLGSNVIFEGFPAKRDSDGYVGLYDRITGQFYLPENQNYLTYD